MPSGVSSGLLDKVARTYQEQSKGWKERNVFQRQWVFRDFKKQTGMSVDEMAAELASIAKSLKGGKVPSRAIDTLNKLGAFYKHQEALLRGFEKNPEKLENGLKAIRTWIDEIQAAIEAEESK